MKKKKILAIFIALVMVFTALPVPAFAEASGTPSATASDTTSASPTDTTSASPADTTSASPADTTSASPANTTSASPADTTSASPTNTTSASPTNTTSASPTDTTSASDAAQPSLTTNTSMQVMSWGLKWRNVTFVENGGTDVDDSNSLDWNDYHINQPTCTRTGYTLDGWYTTATFDSSSKVTFPYLVTGNVTMYAKWTPIAYTITLNPNGGTLHPDNNTITQNYDADIKNSDVPNVTFKGHTFLQWREGSTAISLPYKVHGNATWNAIWQNTVSYVVTGGDAIADSTVEYGTTFTPTTPAARTGYTFSGWFTDANWTVQAGSSFLVTSDMTLYGKWTINQYNITTSTTGSGSGSIISPTSSPTSVTFNTSLAITYNAASGNHVQSITVDGTKLSNISSYLTSYTFSNVQAAHSFVVEFEPDYETITASVTNGSITSPSTTTVSVPYGGSQTFKYNPNTGYHLSSVVINGATDVTSSSSSSYTFSNVTSAQTIAITYAINTYKITTSTTGTGSGSIDSTTNANYGSSVTIHYTPDDHCGVYYVKVDGNYVDTSAYGSSYTFTNVQGTHSIEVYFAHECPDISATPYSGAYDGKSHTAKVNDGSFTSLLDTITYSSDGGNTYTLSSAPKYTNAGTYTVYFKVVKQIVGLDIYAPYYGSATVTITPLTLTVTANPITLTYGDAVPTTDTCAAYTGFLSNETQASVVTGTPGFTTTYTPTSNAGGSYTITPTQGTLSATNYTFSFVAGKVTVGKAAATVTANDMTVKYGSAVPTYTYSFSGLKNGQTDATSAGVTGTATLTCDYTITSASGSKHDIIFSTMGLSATNYTFTYKGGTLTVIKANEPDVTLQDVSVTYDGQPHTVKIVSGTLPTDKIQYSSTGADGSYSDKTITYTNVTGGAIKIWVKIDRDNYETCIRSATVTITPATLTITASPMALTYGDVVPTTDTYTPSGYVNGETSSVISGTPAYATTYTPTSVAGGSYTITPSQGTLTAKNYTFTFASGAVTVTKAQLTVTANSISVQFGSTPSYDYTINPAGYKNGQTDKTTAGITGTAVCGSVYTTTTAEGTKLDITFTTQGLSATNYKFNYVNGLLTVNAADAPNVVLNDTTATYDGSAHGIAIVSGTADGDQILYSSTGADGSYNSTPITYTDVTGSAMRVYVQVARANYSTYSGSATVTVTPAELKITADPISLTYGDAVPATDTYTPSGFVNGETDSVISGTPGFDTTYTPTSSVGGYTITPKLGSLYAKNYTFSYASGTVTVGQATLKVTADDQSVKYGGTPTYTYKIDATGFKNSETEAAVVMGTAVCASAYTATTPEGTKLDIAFTTQGLSATNYKFSYVNGLLTVNAADAPNVVLNDTTATYDGSAHGITFVSGTADGDQILYSSTGADDTFSSTPITYTDVTGSAMRVYVQVVRANYSTFSGSATVTVTPVTLNVTADPITLTYGDTVPTTDTYKITGFVNSEADAVVDGAPGFSTTYTATSAAGGSYTITPSLNSLSAKNYSFNFTAGEVTVGQATVNVIADDKSVKYGGTPIYTYAIDATGFKNSETETTAGITGSAVCGSTYTTTTPEGTKLDITFTTQGLSATNYKFNYVNGLLTVNAADAPDVVLANTSVAYDGTPHTIQIVSGTESTDQILYSSSGDVGSYSSTPITYTDATTGAVRVYVEAIRANYTPFYGSATVTVSPVTLTVAATNMSVTYGDAAPSYDVTYNGFITGEDKGSLSNSLVLDCSYAAGNGAGTYVIQPSGFTSTNYTINYVNGTLTVNPAPLTVTANDEVVTYGDAVPAYTASYTGFVNGDNVSSLSGTPTFDCSYAKNSAVGSYPIAISGLTANNYTITFVAGTLKVNAAPTSTYWVKFLNYDGTLLKVQWIDSNGAATAPANPTRPGYTFTGWSTSFDKVTGNITTTALFTPVVAAAAAPVTQPTVIPTQSAPAGAPSVSPSASASSQTTVIPTQSAPAAAPSMNAQAQTGNGFPWWIWIIIAAGVAAFLIWLFGFKLRKKEQH